MESSIDKSALLSVKAQGELLGEEEENGIIETEEKVIVHQICWTMMNCSRRVLVGWGMIKIQGVQCGK